MLPPTSDRPFRRRVFYIPGYDPMPPRRYRELYRRESAAQAEISGYSIAQAPDPEAGHGWQVSATLEDRRVETRFDVLVWSDIVRETMNHGLAATYGQLVRTAWIYITSGTLGRLLLLRKGPILAGFYPVLMLLFQAALAFGIGAVAAGLVGLAAGAAVGQGSALLGRAPGPAWSWIAAVLWWAVALWVTVRLLQRFRSWDGRLYAWYLMHDLAFAAQARGAYPEALSQRISAFAGTIAAALRDPETDEVLVVGHSSGAQLAVSALAEIVRAEAVPIHRPALSLLTLGQSIPMVSFLPKAQRLRADLHDLAASERVPWVDVSAPGDGCSFALCDPVAVSGVAPKGARWPLVISAAFTQSLSEARWKRLRWRFFRLHFQYLCAFDTPKGYDYFRITAGPLTLEERFAERKPSMNRIDVPASRFTSRAA